MADVMDKVDVMKRLTHQVRLTHPGGTLPDVVSEPLPENLAREVADRLPARFRNAGMEGREFIVEQRCDLVVGCTRGHGHKGRCSTR